MARSQIALVAGKKLRGMSLKGKSARQLEMERPGPSPNGYLFEHGTCGKREVHPRALALTSKPRIDSGSYADAINMELA